MIAFLPHCGFLSEVSRAIAIAAVLRDRGERVVFAARGGPYAHLIAEAGFPLADLAPTMDGAGATRFLEAVLSMGKTDLPFYEDDELAEAVDAEVRFLRGSGARIAVTGFTLTSYLSTRVAGIPLATDHGGVMVPPVLAHKLAPVPVNPPVASMKRLPRGVQRLLANFAPALLQRPVAQLNRHAKRLGVEPLPNLLALMCGELTLITELPEVVGLSAAALERWTPRWPFRVRSRTTFQFTGPLFATLDRAVPPEVEAFLRADGPVVYLSPTSVHEPFLRLLVTQAKAAGARVLVGSTVHDIRDLGDERTLIAGVLPNHLVMPRVAAAVIMGGQGSVQTAMTAGVPFVGIPYHGEQELNVAVAERLGAAIRLAPHEATSGALAHQVKRLLDEPTFAASAKRAALHYRGVDGAARAASAIVSYLSKHAAKEQDAAQHTRARTDASAPQGASARHAS